MWLACVKEAWFGMHEGICKVKSGRGVKVRSFAAASTAGWRAVGLRRG